MTNEEKQKTIELCKIYNPQFLEKLQRDFLEDYIIGCEAGEEVLYFEMLLQNIYEVDPNLQAISTNNKSYLIELIKKLPLEERYNKLFHD